jgi:divalent metal cation (Fe/Co/Zn/Cd) transporter
VGTIVVVTAAVQAGSVALAGFGFDSLIEILASLIVVWQLKNAVSQACERAALRAIAAAFLALAVYVSVAAVYALGGGARPAPSVGGMLGLVMTVVVMLLPAWGKLRTGRHLGNSVLLTEARVTLMGAYLAAAVLVGAGLNAGLGYWWADPVSSLFIVFYGVREAIEAWNHASEP